MGVRRNGMTEVVLAVVDTRPDPATERFDAELAAAVAAGRLDEATARTLRWWQRESIRDVRSYLADALPAVLDALDAAAASSADAVDESARTWDSVRRTPTPGRRPAGGPADEQAGGQPHGVAAESARPRPVASTATTDRLRDRRRELIAGLVADPPQQPPNGHQQRSGRPGSTEGRR